MSREKYEAYKDMVEITKHAVDTMSDGGNVFGSDARIRNFMDDIYAKLCELRIDAAGSSTGKED